MKTAVAHSSLQTHDALRGAGFAALQELILARMKPGRMYSRRQIAQLAHLETSTTAGRVNELIALGAIAVCGTIKCPMTGRSVEGIRRAGHQLELLA